MLLGKHRYDRGQKYFTFLNKFYPNNNTSKVNIPNADHDKDKIFVSRRFGLYFKRIEPMNRNNTFNAFKIASTAIISIVMFNSCSSDIENKKNNDIIKVDPFQQNIKIARSINLGNALDAPNEANGV